MSATPISWPESLAADDLRALGLSLTGRNQLHDQAVRSRAPSVEPEEDYGAPIEPVTLVLDYKDRKLAACYYLAADCRICVLDDAADVYAPYDRVEAIRFAVQPDLVLLSSRAAEAFLADQPIEQTADAEDGDEAEEQATEEIALLRQVHRKEIRPVADVSWTCDV